MQSGDVVLIHEGGVARRLLGFTLVRESGRSLTAFVTRVLQGFLHLVLLLFTIYTDGIKSMVKLRGIEYHSYPGGPDGSHKGQITEGTSSFFPLNSDFCYRAHAFTRETERDRETEG